MKNVFLRSILFYFFINPLWAKDLTIATVTHSPPFAFQDEVKGLSGFDIDLMTALCKGLERHCTFKTYEFSQLLPALKKGEVDLAIAAIMITPQRQKQFLFSLPYKLAKLQFITLAKTDLTAPSQLLNKQIGLYKNAPDRYYVEMKFKGQVQLHYYDHVEELFDALRTKKVDAIVVERPRAEYWLANIRGFKMLGKSFMVGKGYGIATNLGQNQLIEEINKLLKQMEKNGVYLQIYKLYFP